MKLSPLERLALQVVGWGVIALLSFFFHVVAFCAVIAVLASKTLLFRFVYLNTKEYNDTKPSTVTEEPTFPELGAEWERGIRENLPKSDGRRDEGNLG